MKKTIIIALIIFVAIIGLYAGLGLSKKNDNKPDELMFWTLQLWTFSDYLQPIIDEFEKSHPEIDDDHGVSLVMINSDKGEKVFEEISNQLIVVPSNEHSINQSHEHKGKCRLRNWTWNVNWSWSLFGILIWNRSWILQWRDLILSWSRGWLDAWHSMISCSWLRFNDEDLGI